MFKETLFVNHGEKLPFPPSSGESSTDSVGVYAHRVGGILQELCDFILRSHVQSPGSVKPSLITTTLSVLGRVGLGKGGFGRVGEGLEMVGRVSRV